MRHDLQTYEIGIGIDHSTLLCHLMMPRLSLIYLHVTISLHSLHICLSKSILNATNISASITSPSRTFHAFTTFCKKHASHMSVKLCPSHLKATIVAISMGSSRRQPSGASEMLAVYYNSHFMWRVFNGLMSLLGEHGHGESKLMHLCS